MNRKEIALVWQLVQVYDSTNQDDQLKYPMKRHPNFQFPSQFGTHTLSSSFFQKKTPSTSYKLLHMRVLYANPCRDTIVPSYVDAH